MDSGKVLSLPDGGGVRITAFKSTDQGIAFLVENGGKVLYHAGDLNDWKWTGESKAWNNDMDASYRRELEKIRNLGLVPDVAMLPLDGRQEEWFYLGIHEFMEIVGAKAVLPMHFWEDYDIIRRLKTLDCTTDYRDKITEIRQEGQTFIF